MIGFMEQLEASGQLRLKTYLESVSDTVRERVTEQLNVLGLDRVISDYKDAMAYNEKVKASSSGAGFGVLPPKRLTGEDLSVDLTFTKEDPVVVVDKSEMSSSMRETLWAKGAEAIRDGRVACVMLAGGQGSRLGFDGPKGCFKLSNGNTIFQTIIPRVKEVADLCQSKNLPFYVMTSTKNSAATKQHFQDNDDFGVKIITFNQTEMPSFDLQGNILMENEENVTANPNGNGGVFASLKITKVLDQMKKDGIQYLHVFGVDNVLVRPADPLFIGMMIQSGVAVGNKCCTKQNPAEKVGVAVIKELAADHRRIPSTVEYTEISAEQAQARVGGKDSPLLFSSANIVNHFFTLDFIEQALASKGLQYHVAMKKIAHYDYDQKCVVKPSEVNGVKLEYFIFDAFELAPKLVVFEVSRDEEFSPVKNASGDDSPDTAANALQTQANKLPVNAWIH